MIDPLLLGLPVYLPLLTALITLFFGKKIKKFISILPILAFGAVSSVLIAFIIDHDNILGTGLSVDFIIPSILGNNSNGLSIGLVYTELGLFMALIASGLSFLIALFSVEYMENDKYLIRYWFFFLIFLASMNLLVLAADLFLLYVGWEGVGLCSFALIAHWYKNPGEEGSKPARAGIKAFVFTHIGDIGLLLAIAIIYGTNNTISFDKLRANFVLPAGYDSIVMILIFFAVIGKSAQFPLLTWLSSPDSVDIDAMQGPTTVSALIHAATMVKAGIFLIAQFYPIFRVKEVEFFSQFMAIIVGITIVIAAFSALTATDLKRVLAYSTISQLSYMLLALCVAFFAYADTPILANTAFISSQAHLLMHAIFKALLFLSAAAIIHSLHTRSLKEIGGLKTQMPIVFYTMLIGALALIGIPFFSGFFSKEAIIGVTYDFALSNTSQSIWGWYLFILALIVVALTAAYTTRMIMLIFSGEPLLRQGKDPKKPKIIIKSVLIILAVFSLTAGFIIEFLGEWFHNFIGDPKGKLHLIPEGNGLISTVLTLVMVFFGIYITFYIFRGGNNYWNTNRMPKLVKSFQTISAEGFYIDQSLNYLGKRILNLLYSVRRIHSGNLNYNMIGVSIVFMFVFVVVFII